MHIYTMYFMHICTYIYTYIYAHSVALNPQVDKKIGISNNLIFSEIFSIT